MKHITQIIFFCVLVLIVTSIIGSSNIESSIFHVSRDVQKPIARVEKYVDEISPEDLSNIQVVNGDIQLEGEDGEIVTFTEENMNNVLSDAVSDESSLDVTNPVSTSVARRLSNQMKHMLSSAQNPIMSDRIHYFRIGLANFFTRQDYVMRKSPLDFQMWIQNKVYVWPSYQDVCCKSLDKGSSDLDCACDNINISNSSCLDTLMKFHNEPRLTTIEGNIGASKASNCTMTILGNDYMLMKRSIGLKIKEIKQVSIGDMKSFRVNVSGQMALFALSRPMFLSFNTSGLYRVIHEDKNQATTESEYEAPAFSNMFAHFDSSRTQDNIMYLKQVAHDEVENMRVFHETNTNIGRTFDPSKTNQAVTLYYMNYRSEVKIYDARANVFNFFINQKIYNTSFRLSNTIEILTGNERTQEIKSVTLQKTPEGILELRIDGKLYPLPQDFVYYDPIQYQRFDICITISYDIVLITCYCIDSQTRKNICYMTRYNLAGNFSLPKESLLDTIKIQSPDMFFMMRNDLKDVMSITSIPNYAHLAYTLGYVFNLS